MRSASWSTCATDSTSVRSVWLAGACVLSLILIPIQYSAIILLFACSKNSLSQLGTHQRGKRKRDELADAIRMEAVNKQKKEATKA